MDFLRLRSIVDCLEGPTVELEMAKNAWSLTTFSLLEGQLLILNQHSNLMILMHSYWWRAILTKRESNAHPRQILAQPPKSWPTNGGAFPRLNSTLLARKFIYIYTKILCKRSLEVDFWICNFIESYKGFFPKIYNSPARKSPFSKVHFTTSIFTFSLSLYRWNKFKVYLHRFLVSIFFVSFVPVVFTLWVSPNSRNCFGSGFSHNSVAWHPNSAHSRNRIARHHSYFTCPTQIKLEPRLLLFSHLQLTFSTSGLHFYELQHQCWSANAICNLNITVIKTGEAMLCIVYIFHTLLIPSFLHKTLL